MFKKKIINCKKNTIIQNIGQVAIKNQKKT